MSFCRKTRETSHNWSQGGRQPFVLDPPAVEALSPKGHCPQQVPLRNVSQLASRRVAYGLLWIGSFSRAYCVPLQPYLVVRPGFTGIVAVQNRIGSDQLNKGYLAQRESELFVVLALPRHRVVR
jgi:hypothetical protein